MRIAFAPAKRSPPWGKPITETEAPSGSDGDLIDACENTSAGYGKDPELTEAGSARGSCHVEGRSVGEAEGRAAMAAAMAAHREHVDIELPADIVVAFRAEGPDWRERMTEAVGEALGRSVGKSVGKSVGSWPTGVLKLRKDRY